MQEAVRFFLVTCWEKDPESSGRAETCELVFWGDAQIEFSKRAAAVDTNSWRPKSQRPCPSMGSSMGLGCDCNTWERQYGV